MALLVIHFPFVLIHFSTNEGLWISTHYIVYAYRTVLDMFVYPISTCISYHTRGAGIIEVHDFRKMRIAIALAVFPSL